MKIVFFSPVALSSAIGRMGKIVVESLDRLGHKVAVVRSEDLSQIHQEAHPFAVEIIDWRDDCAVGEAIGNADCVIYQIGNSYQFHRGCLEWIERAPGMVILHDFFLGHLFYEWAKDKRTEAQDILNEWYGASANDYFNFKTAEQFVEVTSKMAPMTEWICAKATGVVTHSSWGINRVLESCAGPVCTLSLAYDAPEYVMADENNESAFTITTIGHINANKRIESVIRAIGSSSVLRSNGRYRLVGPIEESDKNHYTQLARTAGVELDIYGAVSNEDLARHIYESSVMCCLRYPTLEAASASAIESMLYGKATVVIDIGFYHELPDKLVCKIGLKEEVAKLKEQLEYLYKNPGKRKSLGASAAEWAKQTFNPDTYAEELLDFCEAVAKATPWLNASNFYKRMMQDWGATGELVALPQTIDALNIFGSKTEYRTEERTK